MKKLRLEDLQVNSFPTGDAQQDIGTVRAHQVYTVDSPFGNDCRNTWNDWTCDRYSCNASCANASCNGGCGGTDTLVGHPSCYVGCTNPVIQDTGDVD